jgi:hypothetical protein
MPQRLSLINCTVMSAHPLNQSTSHLREHSSRVTLSALQGDAAEAMAAISADFIYSLVHAETESLQEAEREALCNVLVVNVCERSKTAQ